MKKVLTTLFLSALMFTSAFAATRYYTAASGGGWAYRAKNKGCWAYCAKRKNGNECLFMCIDYADGSHRCWYSICPGNQNQQMPVSPGVG